MRRLLFCVAMALAAASPALAAGDDSPDAIPPPPPCVKDGAPVPDDYAQIARDVMIASRSSDRMAMILDAMLPSILDLARKAEPNISDEAFAAIRVAVREEMLRELPQLVSASACIYVEHFSRDELSQLVAWYKSPVGQKLIAEGPSIMQEALPIGRAWGEKAGRTAIERVLERYRSKGDKT